MPVFTLYTLMHFLGMNLCTSLDVSQWAMANMFTSRFAAVGYSHRISDPRRTRIDSPSKSSHLTTKLHPSLKHTPRISLAQTLQANHWHWASRKSSEISNRSNRHNGWNRDQASRQSGWYRDQVSRQSGRNRDQVRRQSCWRGTEQACKQSRKKSNKACRHSC